ncbi:hypothetical protein [Haloarcula japonica]|uniref:Uncharacterized protein n=1 Tax=Haloarcula japonica (strain ATCC 49778 / DSM 6131 / JCM 7785 / NBRC 101032 / NCIMB 13157 / TR-1) TaxID=1227453 RepID=M0LHN8_HALJT|nr:hypothetical protein [Haloarcula japonica]EMA33031.1 hypothetical protein C444_07426 [Haloarcula japonica DSM 6131]
MVANERGQLLLIGGIAVAIVVFSTILFAHSLAVTDGITTTGSAETIERSADREASVERDLGRLAAETRGDDLDGFEERYENALRNYTETHNRVVGGSSGVYLNAKLNESASLGTEVNQTNPPAQFKKPTGGGGAEWTLAENTTQISVFKIAFIDLNGPGNRPTTISVENATSEWTMALDRASPGSSKKQVQVNGGDVTGCSGAASRSVNITLYLHNGTCLTDSTSVTFVPFTDQLKGPYNITIKKGSKSIVQYRVAAIGTFPRSNYASPVARVNYPVIPAVDTTYDTPSASYNRTVLVEVDDG